MILAIFLMYLNIIRYLCTVIIHTAMETKDINRLKIILAEKKKTNKWLAEQIKKDPATVSKWCTNTSQPSLEILLQIAKVLEVDVKDLLHSSKDDEIKFVRIS